MRSVSLFLPPGLRTSGSRSHGQSSKVRPAAGAPSESGIGIVLDQTDDGRLVVAQVWPGSPAAAAGICPGDVLLLIDGMQGSVSSIDVAKDLIRGEEGTAVTLQVLRGITQLEFGPIARHSWVTIQKVPRPGPRVRGHASPRPRASRRARPAPGRPADAPGCCRWTRSCTGFARWGRTAGCLRGAPRSTLA